MGTAFSLSLESSQLPSPIAVGWRDPSLFWLPLSLHLNPTLHPHAPTWMHLSGTHSPNLGLPLFPPYRDRSSRDHGRREERLKLLTVCEENGRSPSGRREKAWTPQMEKDKECFFGPSQAVSEKDFCVEKKEMPVIRGHVIKRQTQDIMIQHLLGASNQPKDAQLAKGQLGFAAQAPNHVLTLTASYFHKISHGLAQIT